MQRNRHAMDVQRRSKLVGEGAAHQHCTGVADDHERQEEHQTPPYSSAQANEHDWFLLVAATWPWLGRDHRRGSTCPYMMLFLGIAIVTPLNHGAVAEHKVEA